MVIHLHCGSLCIQLLSQSRHAESLLPQFHRYLSITKQSGVVLFENSCALGESNDIGIQFNLVASELPGYARLLESPAECVRVCTALIDYLCFTTNSQTQTAYTTSKRNLAALCIANFTTVRHFKDNEIALYTIFHAYARKACRSSIATLDWELQIPCSLSTPLREELDAFARKKVIPENYMDINFVFSQLTCLEKRDAAEFPFWTKPNTPAPPTPAPASDPMPNISATPTALKTTTPDCSEIGTVPVVTKTQLTANPYSHWI